MLGLLARSVNIAFLGYINKLEPINLEGTTLGILRKDNLKRRQVVIPSVIRNIFSENVCQK